jgi:uncharacterized membrane protein
MTSTLSDLLATFDDPAKAHAAMVHLPIALAFLAPLFLLAAGAMPGRRRMGSFLAVIAYAILAIATLVTIQSGESAYDAIGDVPAAIGTMAHEHGEMAERVWTWGLVGAALAGLGLLKEKKKLAIGGVWAAFAFGVFTAGWTAVAAHEGGTLVYDHGVGIPEPIPDDDPDASDPRLNFFVREVRPILVENCMGCHRDGRPAAGLDMTSMRAILEGAEHGQVLKPGNPEGSMLMTVIRGQHPEIGRMPPGKSGPLPDEQIESIRLWIEQGAVWQP